MSIFRVHKNKTHPYTIIDNTSINDKRLSAKSKGILLFLISKPDHWFINFRNLIFSFTDGERSIRSGINELIKFGYIVRSHVRSNDGRFTSYDYSVFEQPLKESISASYSPPDCRNAVLDNAVLDNAVLVNTDNKENTKNNNNNTVVDSISPKSAAVVLSRSNSKTKIIKLLKKLSIKNYKKLFDLFPVSDIFMYANWMQSRTLNIKNPTGFLITAIKEKWIDGMDLDSYYDRELLFYYRCKKCNTVFGYPEEILNYTFCNKCGGS